MDLREQKGYYATRPKILIACDETIWRPSKDYSIIRDYCDNQQLECCAVDMVQTVVDSALPRSRKLSRSDIILLLRPRTLLTDIETNADLIKALGVGRIYATVSTRPYGIDEYVELYSSPLMLRDVLLRSENQKDTAVIENLKGMLKFMGLRDLREFRKANADDNGKIFEDFFLNMEMLRRGFQFSELKVRRVQSFEELYPTVRYSQNCKNHYQCELASDYDVVEISCQSDFPSRNPVDAPVVKRVKSLIDGSSANYSVFRPSNENQAGYDFFFILKDLSTGMRYVQLIEPTLSAGAGATPDAFFIERYVKKLKAVQSHFSNRLGDSVQICGVLGQQNSDFGQDRSESVLRTNGGCAFLLYN
eukprot:gene29294-38367_t